MATINPHINFNGNAEEAFNFYQSVFGGEIMDIIRFGDIKSPGFPVEEIDVRKIMQMTLSIGNSLLMANDVPDGMGRVSENENRSKIFVVAGSKDEADSLFNGLSAGGTIEGAMGESPWGSYIGTFRDKFGIEWIVEYSPNKNF